MAFGKVIEARLRGTLHGSETINVFHFGTNSETADFDALVLLLTALANAILQCALGQLLGAVTQDWRLIGVDCKQLDPVVSDPIEVAAAADSVGTRQSTNTSFETINFKVQTGMGGKRKRGRHFLPPPGDGDMTNSLLDAGDSANFYEGFIECLAGKFIGPAKTTEFTLGVLSRKTLKEPGGTYATAFTPAVQLVIDTKVGCLRSRKLGHGV